MDSAVEVVYFGVKMILAMKAKKVTKDCKKLREGPNNNSRK